MVRQSMLLGTTIAIAISLGLLGCDRSESSDSGSSSTGSSSSGGGGAGLTGVKREAADAAMSEVKKKWAKAADGWTTAITTGVAMAPDHYMGQFRDITVDEVENIDVSEAEKMNGVEWNGQVSFKKAPYREAGDPGIAFDGMLGGNYNRRRGQWTQWVDYQAEAIHIWKAKGQWKTDSDTFLLRDNKKLPTAADFGQAGVK